MNNNYKKLLLMTTLIFTGQSFAQGSPAPGMNQGVNPTAGATPGPRTGPAVSSGANPASPVSIQAVRQAPRPNPGLKPCESVTVDPPTYLTLGKSRVIRLPFPAARMLLGGQSSSRAGQPVNVGDKGAAGAAPAPAASGAEQHRRCGRP